jgi:hypothetical protein
MKGQNRDLADTQGGYVIHVLGTLDERWSDWFQGLKIVDTERSGQIITSIVCPSSDQALLRGILNKLWDLNLTLLSVEKIHQPGSE